MKQFTYVIQDPLGIHARPAGLLVKTAKAFSGTEISVTKGDKTVKSTQLTEAGWAWGRREATPSPSPPNDGSVQGHYRRCLPHPHRCRLCQGPRLSRPVVYGDAGGQLFLHPGGRLPARRALPAPRRGVQICQPIFIGDTLTVKGTVVSVSEIGSEAEIKAVITNQDGKRVTRGIIKAGLAK